MATKSEQQEYDCDINSNFVELFDINFQNIKRSFEVHLYDVQDFLNDLFKETKNKHEREEYIKEMLDDHNGAWTFFSNRSFPFYLRVQTTRNKRDDYCNDSDECSYKNLTTINIIVCIYFNNKIVFSNYVPLKELSNVKADIYPTYIEKLCSNLFSTLKRSYEFCKCGEECFSSRKQCKDCYINNYTHDDKCGICLENNYRWLKLKCGHIFHTHCLKKLEIYSPTVKKCPLCRAEWDFHNAFNYPM
jgi:hypothetical protein